MKHVQLGLLAVTVALGGCSKSASLGLGVMVPTNATPAALTAAAVTSTPSAGALTISDGTHTLVVNEAKLVLKHIELEMTENSTCGTTTTTSGESEQDDCDEVKTPATVVTLPIDGSIAEQITANVTPGTYEKVSFQVHKLGDDHEDVDAAAIAPDMMGASVKVTGTYDGVAFTYYGAVEAVQEVSFSPPLVIADGSTTTGVTLSVDMTNWFVSNGALVDPSTAGVDGVNRELIERNIQASIRGFQDDDHDGVPHAEDPSED